MKVRDSGMPDEAMWEGFFDPAHVLCALGLTRTCRNVVEIGCGYGTFTIPAARVAGGTVYAFDIEPGMIAATNERAAAAGLTNIDAIVRDICTDGTGLADGFAEYVMLFNILHADDPMSLLRECHRVLVSGGTLGVIHWNFDSDTPRGPSLDIRPRPEQCLSWAKNAGFHTTSPRPIDLPPYHYGLTFTKP